MSIKNNKTNTHTKRKKALEKSMGSDNTNNKRRQLLVTTLGLGAVGSVMPTAWTKPIINSVVLPAHAQTSCPMIVIGNARISPVSPQTQPATCAVAFELRSDDPAVALEIISVTDDSTDDTENDAPGEATSTAGVEVRWQGPTSGAPFCAADDTLLSGDVIFTVMASCELIPDFMFTQDILLSDVLAAAEVSS